MKSNRTNYVESPIVFLHGWGMNRQVWNGLIESLPQDIASRVVALDMPGYGDNKIINSGIEFSDLVNWLEEKVSKPSVIVGWSLGGLVAQQFAIQYPEKVSKLGLVATTPYFVQTGNWSGIKPQVLTLFSKQLTEDHTGLIDKFMAIQAMGSESAKQDIKQIKHWVLSKPTPNAEVLAAGLAMLENIDLRSQLSHLPKETHMILGKLDSLVPQKMTEKLTDINPEISVTVVDKASHAPFISHPEVFIEWLLNLSTLD